MLAALKWMLPLMVKSIGNGDIVARLTTVTIADYNSPPPLLPKYGAPLSHHPFLDEVWGHQREKGVVEW